MGWHAKVPGAEVPQGLRDRNSMLGFEEHWLQVFFLATTVDKAALSFLAEYAHEIDALAGEHVLFVTFYNEALLEGETLMPDFYPWGEAELGALHESLHPATVPPAHGDLFATRPSDYFYRRLPNKAVELCHHNLCGTINLRLEEDYGLKPDEIFVVSERERNPWDIRIFLRSMLQESNRFCDDLGIDKSELPCCVIIEDLSAPSGWLLPIHGGPETFALLRRVLGQFLQQAASHSYYQQMTRKKRDYAQVLACHGAIMALEHAKKIYKTGNLLSLTKLRGPFLNHLPDALLKSQIEALLQSQHTFVNQKKAKHAQKLQRWIQTFRGVSALERVAMVKELARRRKTLPSWLVGKSGIVAENLAKDDFVGSPELVAEELEAAIQPVLIKQQLLQGALGAFDDILQNLRNYSSEFLGRASSPGISVASCPGILDKVCGIVPEARKVMLATPPGHARDVREASRVGRLAMVMSHEFADRAGIHVSSYSDPHAIATFARPLAPLQCRGGVDSVAGQKFGRLSLTDAGEAAAPPCTRRGEELRQLQSRFETIRSMHAQDRGYRFEGWFLDLVRLFATRVEQPFVGAGEQTDGAFELSGWVVICECKWKSVPIGPREVLAFKAKVDERALGTLGLLVSMSGFSAQAAAKLQTKEGFNVLLFGQADVLNVLSGSVSLDDLFRERRWFACCHGKAVFKQDLRADNSRSRPTKD